MSAGRLVDLMAVAFLERAPEVAGVYPVRVTYPASASSALIEKGGLYHKLYHHA